MRLDDFVARYPGIRLAEPGDNARILDFFDRSPMETRATDVQYRRSPDFFKLLRFQAERAHVFLAIDASEEVHAVGTATLRPGWAHGKPITIGYLGDLRIGFDRKVIAHWRTFYGGLMAGAREIEELADCGCWFTAILDDNALARRSLARGRTGAPVYVPLAPFTMRNVVARLPLGRRTLRGGWNVRTARPGDANRIDAFFEGENARLSLGFRGEFSRRLRQWDGLAITDFVIAESGDAIMACMAPWSPSAAKHTIVRHIPRTLRMLGVIPGRRIRIPSAGEPLRMAYLTHLTFGSGVTAAARGDVFRSMLDHVFDRWPEA
ncbi:MAG: hypothetical protein H7066_05920, partial [Cytophagaceae bacterium]|nr:hypothetical protein [Gemmatimonadaceae bacterium]